MFLTNKKKRYRYYYKDKRAQKQVEENRVKAFPSRFYTSIKVLQGGYITINPLKSIVRLYK